MNKMLQSQKKIKLAIELSQQIIELTQQQDWSQIDQLDAQRMELLQSIFSDQSLDLSNEKIREGLQQLGHLNNEALALCAKAKKSIQAETRTFRRGREAVSTYQKHISIN